MRVIAVIKGGCDYCCAKMQVRAKQTLCIFSKHTEREMKSSCGIK